MSSIVVLGATSLVGHWLLPRLEHAGHSIHAIGRHIAPTELGKGVTWHRCDVTNAQGVGTLPACLAAVSLLPLWLLPPAMPALTEKGCRRIIAFSSTSVLTKADSADLQERQLAERLATAEGAATEAATRLGLSLCLLRPTMIYDGIRDKNVRRLRDLLRRYRCFPLFGGGRGLRQPVHADDLAAAATAALTLPASTRTTTYTLSGGETLRYSDMIRRIAAADGLRPILVNVPADLIKPAAALARLFPRFRELNPAMLMRMSCDLVFDHSDATHDLGFSPREFTLD